MNSTNIYCLPPSYTVGTHPASKNTEVRCCFCLNELSIYLRDTSANKCSDREANVSTEVTQSNMWYWRWGKNIKEGPPEVMMPKLDFENVAMWKSSGPTNWFDPSPSVYFQFWSIRIIRDVPGFFSHTSNSESNVIILLCLYCMHPTRPLSEATTFRKRLLSQLCMDFLSL